MRKIITLLFLLLLNCCAYAQIDNDKKKFDPKKEGYVKASVVNAQIEDCGYIIVLPDNTKLHPDVLASEFKKHKLKVWIKYSIPKNQLPNTCMVGKSIKVEGIKRR